MPDSSDDRLGSAQLRLPEDGEQGSAPTDSSAGIGADADSPELLRWRADILLDEMMLGAVDVAAGRPDSIGPDPAETGPSGIGLVDEPPREPPREPLSSIASAVGRYDSAGPASVTPETAAMSGAEDADRSYAVPAAFSPGTSSPSASAPAPEAETFLRPPTASLVAAGEVASPVDGRVESAANAWQRDLSASSAFDDQDRRSNLLPRESQVNVSSRLREIDQLETDLGRALPSEHEWSVRSRHLLAKAANILQHNPERSAEVDYYLQQVRSILERAQQADTYSKLYVKRLTLYLTAWALFAAVGLIACLIYAEEIGLVVAGWFDLASNGILATQLPALLVTLSAAALGASIGALRIMGRYRRLGRGYIDRKYSLRCLLLPLLSLLFGLLIYLLFGLITFFAGIDPLQEPLIGIIPAFLAFVFGLVQEYLYGTAA